MNKRWRSLLPFGGRLAMPPRRVSLWFWGLFGAFSAVFMILDTAAIYDSVRAHETFGTSVWTTFKAGLALLFAYGLLGGMLFFMVALFKSVVIPDVVKIYRGVSSVVRATPGAWLKFRDTTAKVWSRFCQGTVSTLRWLGGVPARLRAMSLNDWVASLHAGVSFVVIVGILYLAWPVAGFFVGGIPRWLASHGLSHLFMVQLMTDLIICIIPIALTLTFMSPAFRWLHNVAKNWSVRRKARDL